MTQEKPRMCLSCDSLFFNDIQHNKHYKEVSKINYRKDEVEYECDELANPYFCHLVCHSCFESLVKDPVNRTLNVLNFLNDKVRLEIEGLETSNERKSKLILMLISKSQQEKECERLQKIIDRQETMIMGLIDKSIQKNPPSIRSTMLTLSLREKSRLFNMSRFIRRLNLRKLV